MAIQVIIWLQGSQTAGSNIAYMPIYLSDNGGNNIFSESGDLSRAEMQEKKGCAQINLNFSNLRTIYYNDSVFRADSTSSALRQRS
jgi:hypothetical protein